MPRDPKPAKRKVANRDEWMMIRATKYGPCRVCGGMRFYPMGLHHIVPRSQSGDDVPENLVPLCGTGTMGCHGEVENRDKSARAKLRASLTPEEEAYVRERKGAAWLTRNYGPASPTSRGSTRT